MIKNRGPGTWLGMEILTLYLRLAIVFIMVTNFVLSVSTVHSIVHSNLMLYSSAVHWQCLSSSSFFQRLEKTTSRPFGVSVSGLESFYH